MKKVVYILGCGPSINNITDEEWKYLENKETISFSNFPYKKIRSKYHIATENFYDDKKVLRMISKNKFMDTIIYTHEDETYNIAQILGFNVNKIFVRKGRNNFNGKAWLHKTQVPGKLLDNFGKTKNDPLFTYRGQLSTTLNFAYTLNPDEIRLIGVDLNSQSHFFDTDESLQSLVRYQQSVESKKTKEKDWNKDTIHSTACPIETPIGLLVSITEIIKQLKNEFNEIGKEIYVCNKNSKLYIDSILKYKGVMDE